MSNDKRHKTVKSKHLLIVLATMLICIAAAGVFMGCNWTHRDDPDAGKPERHEPFPVRDPLPGELVQQILMEDSVKEVRKVQLRKDMSQILLDYSKRYRQGYFTGYFITDLDGDGLPELWVKVGSYRDNAKLELYYPMPDGSLVKSDTFAEPGQYYVGEDYIIQVVGSGPGYLNINKISLVKGHMQVENVNGIDLYGDPDAYIPTFAEREIRDTSLNNLSTLNQALI